MGYKTTASALRELSALLRLSGAVRDRPCHLSTAARPIRSVRPNWHAASSGETEG